MRARPSLIALAADRRGVATLVSALALTAVLGFVALGLNAATGFQLKRQLQAASDAAALGGALAIRAGANPAATAMALARANLGDAPIRIEVEHPPAAGLRAGDPRAIRVTIARTDPVLLGALLAASQTLVRASALAEVRTLGPGCLLALAETSPIQGLPLALLSGCVPLSVDEGLALKRLRAAIPYPDVPVTSAPCVPGRLIVSRSLAYTAGNPPPAFCGGIEVAPGGRLRLVSARLLLAGPLDVRPGGTLETRNATILAQGQPIRFHPGAIVSLAPPVAGPLAGVSIAEAASASPAPARFEAGPGQALGGAILLPARDLELAGNRAACTQLIARRIRFLAPTRLGLDCRDLPVRPLVDRTVALVE
ncbi:pilus assembly protein TadG-related protein [Thermaurantiacus sp.]